MANKNKQIYGHFYGWVLNCFMATEPLQGDSLPFTYLSVKYNFLKTKNVCFKNLENPTKSPHF